MSLRDYLFHSEPGIDLYCGDCREVLPLLQCPNTTYCLEACDGRCQSVDLLLTDPPYGMAYKPLRGSDGSKLWVGGVIGDTDPFDPRHLLAFPRLVLFGAQWYANRLPTSGGWLVWDKTPKGAKVGFYASHADLAWTNLSGSIRKFSLQWGGEARNGEPHEHPTQKPVALMRWVIEQFTVPGDLVLDPYAGSGPVLEACRLTNRRAIGIEIEPRYCEIAVKRLRQEVLPFSQVSSP